MQFFIFLFIFLLINICKILSDHLLTSNEQEKGLFHVTVIFFCASRALDPIAFSGDCSWRLWRSCRYRSLSLEATIAHSAAGASEEINHFLWEVQELNSSRQYYKKSIGCLKL
jgi:hypothetical protein